MSATNDGGPAFPVIPDGSAANRTCPASLGMSLRDWFAGQALAGLNAQEDDRTFSGDGTDVAAVDAWRKTLAENDARVAYIYADAMLSARSAPGTKEGE